MRRLIAHHPKLSDLTYSADSGMLFAAGWSDVPEETGLQVWDLGSEKPQAALHHDGSPIEWVRRMGSDRLLIGLWNPPTRDVVLTGAGLRCNTLTKLPIRILRYAAVATSPVADRFAVFGWGEGGTELTCYQFDGANNAVPLWVHRYHPKPVFGHAAEFDATGERVLSTELRPDGSPEIAVRWLSAEDGTALSDPVRLTDDVTHARLLPNASRLIVLTKAHLLSYDLADFRAKPARRDREQATDLTAHPDSRRVFVSCADGVLREYDAATLQELRSYDWKIGKLRCVAVAPDGATAAAVGARRKVVVWNLE